jgi:oligopeptidase B
MKFQNVWFVAILAIFALGCSAPEQVKTKKVPKEFIEFGKARVDDYAWLSNPRDSAVIQHLMAENAYTAAMMKHTEGLQKRLYDELVGRIEQKYESLPIKKNGYWYFLRYEEGQQYPKHLRKKDSSGAPEELVLDVPAMAKGHQIFIVSDEVTSPDNAWLAYGVDTSGGREVDLRFVNLSTRVTSPETIPNTSGDYAWAADGKTLFYAVNDNTVRPFKVMKHRLGADPKTDAQVYNETDSTFQVSLSTTRDNKYIFITSGYTDGRETRYIVAEKPDAPPVMIQSRQKNLAYAVTDHEGDSFLIRTNANAQNFKLVRAPMRNPGMKNWTDLLPHRDDALLESAFVFNHYIFVQQKILGLSKILVIDRRAKNGSHYVDFGEPAYVVQMYTATDAYDLDSIRYIYSSLTTPRTDYLYDAQTGQRVLLKQEKVGGGFVDSLYETKRLWASGPDSVKVPISIVYKKSLFKGDGTNPMLLYAYGSYGITTEPSFNRSVISLLDRGFVYGIAHIRGGQELGRRWYEDGKLLHKKNTFNDFITAAEYLVREKYTSSDRLFAHGGSAGGMLMGAITNMRPDLFRGILADVPWMDVVTDMLNTDLPLTTLEFEEWGNPAIKEQYDYMLSWSPYDNVQDAIYPAILATGGLNDTNVPYFSPAKWVAKVRDHNTGKNPVLFKVNMGAGHGGESGRFERQKLMALRYAFMLDLIGVGK